MFLVARHDHFESVELRGAPKFAHGHDHDVLYAVAHVLATLRRNHLCFRAGDGVLRRQ